jgi:membrane-associated phospholipid phosphatase
MKQRIAHLVSNILNPFLVSFITVILIVYKAANTIGDAVKWGVITLAISVIPVLAFIIYRAKRKKTNGFFPETLGERKPVYLLTSGFALLGCGVVWYLKAPELLIASFITGLAAVVIFMVINLFWKISLHSAFIAASAAMLTAVFGLKAVWVFLLLPLVGWARLELKMHTFAQVSAGAILSVAIITAMFWIFGLVG